MNDYYSFACTSIGFSHIASEKPCQDYSLHFQTDGASVVIVSDGHGSSNFTRSDRGSKFACQVTKAAVEEFLRDVDRNQLENEFLRDDVVMQLCKNILLRWNALVDEDVLNEPFTPQEVEKVSEKYRQRYLNGESAEHAYGCTLIVVIVTGDFCLAIRNGDGECVTVDRSGSFEKPIPWNENCEFNVVTSLCDQEAIEDFRYYYSSELPAAVFIGSDGVDDSYTSADELYHLYRTICLKALDEGVDTVEEYVRVLLPEITKRGSTDDVSIAGLVDPSALAEAKTAMEIAQQLRRMQLAEARREQQKRILLRDIKVAEKKRAKALAERQSVRQKLQGMQASQTGFLEQISIFKRKADACTESMTSLAQDEKQLTDIIDGADSDIARLQSELLALEAVTETAETADSGAPLSVEPAEEDAAVEPEAEDASGPQDTQDVSAVGDGAEDPE